MTKSPFVNLTIQLIDIECAVTDGDAFEFNENIKQVCVERLHKLPTIDQEDEATYVGTIELEEVLLNLLCMAHGYNANYEELTYQEWCKNNREDVIKTWPAFKQHLIDMYA